MSESLNPRQPTGPLSIGNVVSAGLRIYRDHFKLYYRLAFIAYLWILIPIYGWAKFSAISGLISRLAFSEVIERPENVNEARRHVNPRMWNFFLAGFLVFLILFGSFLGAAIIFAIIFGILGTILQQNPAGIVVLVLLGIIVFFAVIFGWIWLYSRLSIFELPIAIENQGDATAAIGRSWNLTQGSVLRLVGIFLVAYLITLPISIVIQIASFILQAILVTIFPADSPIFNLLSSALTLLLGFAGGALLIPFWQAIKAVIYYDLRSRKEGLDLQIRDV